jgi:hypothetical protein
MIAKVCVGEHRNVHVFFARYPPHDRVGVLDYLERPLASRR